MTTREFIAKATQGYYSKPKTCSSVVYDGQHLYSYGTHYPLLVQVAGKWILNDKGYSNTTAKHINWASQYADYRMEMTGKDSLLGQAKAELSQVQNDLSHLRKNAHRKLAYLTYRQAELIKTVEFLAN